MDEKAVRLIKRLEKAESERKTWDRQYEDVALYVLPTHADFITLRSKGDQNRRMEIYDATAPNANHTLAAHMHMALTSPSSPWFDMKFGDVENQENHAHKEWLEESAYRMQHEINSSNFVTAINELYQTLCAFGTAVLWVGENTERGFELVFEAVPLWECFFFENALKRIDTVFRVRKYSHRNAKKKFGNDLPQTAKDALRDNPDDEKSYVNVIMPNEDYDPKNIKSRRFTSIWICRESKEIIREDEGYHELPYMIPRWSKLPTEVLGFGPALMALSDIKILNEAKRLELRSWEKAIDPPMMGMANGVIGDLHIEAGGFTKVRDTRALAPLHDAANWNAVQIKSEEAKKAIQATFLIDQLILPERPNATATEVTIRYELMQRVLGPTMGRLQAELLSPMIDRIFGILYRNRRISKLPDGVDEVDIEYTGPLAKAQRSNDATAIERLFQFVMAASQIDPTAIDVLDMQAAVRIVADRYDVPTKAMRSIEEVEEINEQRKAAQEKQAEVMESQANAATAEAQATEAGSLVAMETMLKEAG